MTMFWHMKSSSRYGLVRGLSTSSANGPRPSVLRFYRTITTVSCAFCRPHLPMVRRCQVCAIYVKSISRDSLVPHCVDDWSEAVSFVRFYVKWSSRNSLVHILSTSSSKSGLTLLVYSHFYVQPSFWYSLVRIIVSTSSSKIGPRL